MVSWANVSNLTFNQNCGTLSDNISLLMFLADTVRELSVTVDYSSSNEAKNNIIAFLSDILTRKCEKLSLFMHIGCMNAYLSVSDIEELFQVCSR